jgi:hypothetical protein
MVCLQLGRVAAVMLCPPPASPEREAAYFRAIAAGLAAVPPPPRDWRAQLEERNKRLPPERQWHRGKPPHEEAPVQMLLAYWSSLDYDEEGRTRGPRTDARPSERALRRMLDACEASPNILGFLVYYLPREGELVERAKRIYERVKDAKVLADEVEIRFHFLCHTACMRDELAKEVLRPDIVWKEDEDGHKSGSAWAYRDWGTNAVDNLASIDWSFAAPILEKLAADDTRPGHACALAQLCAHARATGDAARAERLRKALVAAVEKGEGRAMGEGDEEALGHALTTVLGVEWEGRDAWYVSLFGRAQKPRSLAAPVLSAPERWLPLVCRAIAGGDPKSRGAAAECLLHAAQKTSAAARRVELLRPILPWLGDPAWGEAFDVWWNRERLMRALRTTRLGDCVTGLAWAVEHEEGDLRLEAGLTLAAYRDARAIPALRSALESAKFPWETSKILEALLDLDAFTDADICALLQKRPLIDAFGKLEKGRTRVGPLVPGVWGVRDAEHRWNAPELLEAVAGWDCADTARLALYAMLDLKANANVVAGMVKAYEAYRKYCATDLRLIAERKGTFAGLAAALSGESAIGARILDGDDEDARTALLLAGRLTRLALPFDRVCAAFARAKNDLRSPAGLYLFALDTPAARTVLREAHKDRYLIFGTYGECTGPEDRLDDEQSFVEAILAPDGVDEVFVLSHEYGELWRCDLRVKDGRCGLFQLGLNIVNPGLISRLVSAAELAALRRCIEENDADELASLDYPVLEGEEVAEGYHFLHLTRQGGVRFWIGYPWEHGAEGTPQDAVRQMLKQLADKRD